MRALALGPRLRGDDEQGGRPYANFRNEVLAEFPRGEMQLICREYRPVIPKLRGHAARQADADGDVGKRRQIEGDGMLTRNELAATIADSAPSNVSFL